MDSIVIEYRPASLPSLEAAVLAALDSGVNVVLNLDTLDSLDTEGVRGLITLLRRSRSIGGEVSLRAGKPNVRHTLAVTALDRLFPLVGPEAA